MRVNSTWKRTGADVEELVMELVGELGEILRHGDVQLNENGSANSARRAVRDMRRTFFAASGSFSATSGRRSAAQWTTTSGR